MLDWSLLLVIGGCALVQSLFGTGLLLFGTPALVLMHYPFPMALKILLPCSVAVNACQVWEDRREISGLGAEILKYTVPAIILGLGWVLLKGTSFPLRPVICGMLFFTALIRLRSGWVSGLRIVLARRRREWLVLTGLIHGLSNLGGGPLMLLTSTVFTTKESIRVHTAWGYMLMALSQIVLVEVMYSTSRPAGYVAYPVTALLVYFVLGRRTFRWTANAVFQGLLTGIILLFAILMALGAGSPTE